MYIPPKEANDFELTGMNGLPEYYPVPTGIDHMLFYIQRNQNINTVIYQANLNSQGELDKENPISVYWKRYFDTGTVKPLNFIQRKLAYGYDFNQINHEVIEIGIISYPSYKIYITKDDEGNFKAVSKINSEWAELSNVYVFADESGAFPNVKFIELYGIYLDSKIPGYQRIQF